MTNEQAIKWLKDYIQNTPFQMEQYERAFEMAIQALSQEPCTAEKMIRKTAVMEVIKAHMDGEDKNTKAVLSDVMESVNELETLEQEPCDDAISREWISREWLMRKATERFYTTNYFNHITAMIEEAPPVTQKSGKWIIRDDLSTVRYYQCSECNEIDLDYSDYCPNCGAKMFEPQESEVRNESKG